MSILVATQVTAIATAVLAAGAIVTAILAFLAFRKQAKEVKILSEQAARDIEQRRRDQASRVFTRIEERPFQGSPADMRAAACLRNMSQRPIYDIWMGWGDSGQKRWRVLQPGDEHVFPGVGTSVSDGTYPLWAEFRDAAGIRWRTTSTGEFAELA